MKKLKLLSAMLAIGAISLSLQHEVNAATTASQTITGTLALSRSIVTNGGNLTSVIDPDTGNLNTALTPGFTIKCNSSASQSLTLKATLTDQAGPLVNALYGDGTTNHIILANTAAGSIPTAAAIADIKAGSTDPANNSNAISYTVTTPSNIGGQLTYTWNNPGQYWDATLTHKGNTNTSLTVPIGLPAANTFSADDEVGSYQAVVTLSFV